MRLKALRLFGFKSFADKAEFEFPDGVTAIVGPNGCGKSNVVDAVKWVLGEQRPTALRGKEMADVIFGGTEKRKPLGLAEVTLVFDNADGLLDVDFSEVEVTRRLYRDGSSEYRLNRKKCRLRDLRELLMDTGSGPGALTFMEQGRIDQILRESVSERRAVFEEAAGISKYKARRRECLRRLERVEADLLRVSDVVEEKNKLVRSLRVQAGRAERYRALMEELRAKRLQLAVHRYGRLFDAREAAAARVQEFSASEETARAALQEALSVAQASEGELETAREAASRMEREIATLDGRAENAREKSVFAARLASELDGKIRWYQNEIEEGGARLTELAGSLEELLESREAAEREKDTRFEAVREVEQRLKRARDAHRECRAEVEQLARGLLEAVSGQGRLAGRKSRLLGEAEGCDAREQRIQRRRDELDQEESELADRVSVAERARSEAAGVVESAHGRAARAEARLADAEAALVDAQERSKALEVDVSSTRSRVEVLRNLTERMEGVAEGARKLLATTEKRPLPGVRGLLVDQLVVGGEPAELVESALGDLASAVVVDDLDALRSAAERVRGERLGRCTFVVLGGLAPSVPAAGGGLLDSVRVPTELRGRIDTLLAGARAVEDLTEACRLLAAGVEGATVLVGRDGSVSRVGGAVSVGAAGGGAGLLQRRAELRELMERLERDDARLSAARETLSQARDEVRDARTDQRATRDAVRVAEKDLHRAESERDRIASAGDGLAAERKRLRAELEQVEAQRARVAADVARIEEELADLAARQLDLERRRSDAEAVLERAGVELEQLESERSDARVSLASVSERAASLAARCRRAERETREIEEDLVEARTELQAARERRADAVTRGTQAKAELERVEERREQCRAEVIELRHAVSQAQERLAERRKLAKELDTEATAVARELQKYRLRENEARTRLEGLVERMQEELEVDLVEIWRSRGSSEQAEEAAADPADEVVADEPPFDAEATEEEVQDLRSKLGRMGAVNLEALDQLEAAEAQSRHLQQQHDDLTRSRQSLMQAIQRIDAESRELFTQTFDTVRTHFRDLYRRLFGGGKADVFLEDGVDVLEAGVEIVARPPGKEQRSISLLSGGERTMTAVALMFAIYMAKPSPFCLLDEVDAALDESNVDRFVGVLREFAADSQFIVVTHNKRTMTAAGTIFGVSMPERGVSRRIAVRLEDVGDDGEFRAAG